MRCSAKHRNSAHARYAQIPVTTTLLATPSLLPLVTPDENTIGRSFRMPLPVMLPVMRLRIEREISRKQSTETVGRQHASRVVGSMRRLSFRRRTRRRRRKLSAENAERRDFAVEISSPPSSLPPLFLAVDVDGVLTGVSDR